MGGYNMTVPFTDLSKEELEKELASAKAAYDDFKARDLKLNMARGKPSPEQLDLSLPMLDLVGSKTDAAAYNGGTTSDMRNYGMVCGIPQARELMGQVMGVPAEQVVVGGNSSLTLMYDTVARAMTNGVLGGEPWGALMQRTGKRVKFLCPVPGYDRHFAVTEHLGIEMVNVPIIDDGDCHGGPDMDMVEQLVQGDEMVKGIWCVPKYANPTGTTYSDDVVRRFAALKPAAGDFRIYWDNAYSVHDLGDKSDALLNIADACEEAGNPDIWYEFASTSKVTFAGGGISAMASSAANIAEISADLAFQTIGFDKINQLRHVLFLRDLDGVKAHMKKHASIIAPKFAMVQQVLARELGGIGIGSWTAPRGGYFICFTGLEGTASRTIALAKDAGVTLTGAGAPFPYHKDPNDNVIRIAPTYPSVDELETACELLAVCVKVAAIESLL
jgi:aspartate/methionine/tyrosine aminotransferase